MLCFDRLHNLFNSLQSFRELFFLGAKRNADVTLAIAAEDEARSDEHTRFVKHPFGQVFHIVARVGDASPKEHAYLVGVERTSQCLHDFLGQLPTSAIHLDVGFLVPLHAVVVGLGSSQLQGAEGTRVNV